MLKNTHPSAAADRQDTLAVLVAAFRDDPAVRTLYPTDSEYDRHFAGFLMAFGGRAFDGGHVDRDPENLAAALWFPPGLTPDDEAVMAHLEASMPAERLAVLGTGLEIQGGLHPQEPHWYLPWMGGRPDAQGTGIGSALMARGLARAKADGLPAYVEATSRRSARFYARHGFKEMAIVEAAGYPEIITMWRPAAANDKAA